MANNSFFYIESLDGLYEAVQAQQIFPDSKYFVDCTPRTDAADIVTTWRKLKDQPGFDLKLFVTTHFILPPEIHSNYLSANKPILQHIEDLWGVLKRIPAIQSTAGTLISLPHPYIVPGGRFREIFYWDSYFTMLGLQEARHIDIIESMIDNLTYLVKLVGYVPNGNRTYFLSRSQPPFLSLMIELLAEEKGPDTLLKYAFALEAEYAFWMDGAEQLSASDPCYRRVVLMPDGSVLNRYWDDKATVRPEAWYHETQLAKRSGRDEPEIHRNLRAACESGWDFSSRWFANGQHWEVIETTHLVPVDLNCLLLHLEGVLLKIYTMQHNNAKMQQLQQAIHNRFAAIQQYCWNNKEGFYFDYNFYNQQQTGRYSLAAVYPLFFKTATEEQARHIATTLKEKFLCEGGLITTLIDSGQQWDAPNGWAPLHWLSWKGLQQYDFTELATSVKDRWLKNCERVYAETGKMMEKYNVVDVHTNAGGGKYPNQDGFGWTNGVYLKLLNS